MSRLDRNKPPWKDYDLVPEPVTELEKKWDALVGKCKIWGANSHPEKGRCGGRLEYCYPAKRDCGSAAAKYTTERYHVLWYFENGEYGGGSGYYNPEHLEELEKNGQIRIEMT